MDGDGLSRVCGTLKTALSAFEEGKKMLLLLVLVCLAHLKLMCVFFQEREECVAEMFILILHCTCL